MPGCNIPTIKQIEDDVKAEELQQKKDGGFKFFKIHFVLMGRAGMPTTVFPLATDLVTTDPAPTKL